MLSCVQATVTPPDSAPIELSQEDLSVALHLTAESLRFLLANPPTERFAVPRALRDELQQLTRIVTSKLAKASGAVQSSCPVCAKAFAAAPAEFFPLTVTCHGGHRVDRCPNTMVEVDDGLACRGCGAVARTVRRCEWQGDALRACALCGHHY